MVSGSSAEDIARESPPAQVGETRAGTNSVPEEDLPKERANGGETQRLLTLGHLAARVAHEVNNPLGGILVHAHLLLEDTPEDDPRRKSIEKIIRETDRCKNLVRDLLNFAGRTPPCVKPTDLTSVLREAVSLMSLQRALKEVEISERLAPDLPPVEMDGSQMEQVFTNILQNAGEAMEGKGRITIETGRNGDAVFISFRDTGPGISGFHIEHVFDPFFTRKQSGHGTGLGLAVCQEIVERHGGWITVESRPGEGSAFTVFLPVRRQKGENPSPEEGKSR